MQTEFSFFSPGGFTGLYSKPNSAMLHKGQFAGVDRFRYDSGVFSISDAVTALTPSVPTGLTGTITALGLFEVSLNGTNYLLAAYHSTGTSDARVYTVDTSSGAYTEITAGSGKYGNTRLSNSTNKISVQVVSDLVYDYSHDPANWQAARKDYLIINNGVDAPRVYDQANSAMAIHRVITPPGNDNTKLDVRQTFNTYWTCNGGTMPTYTSSGGGASAASNGTSPENNVRLSFTTGVAVNDTATLDFNGTPQGNTALSNSRQLMFAYRTNFVPIWDYVKVSVSEDNVTYHTVYDPTTTTSGQKSGPFLCTDDVTAVIAFGTTHLTKTTLDTLDAIRYIKFTWAVARPAGSTWTLDLFNIIGSGNDDGKREFKISWFNAGSRSESKAFYFGPDKVRRPQLGDFGASLNGVKWPNEVSLGYKYQVGKQNTSSTEQGLGTDYNRIYVRDDGESDFVMYYENQISSYSGSWSFVSGTEYLFLYLNVGPTPWADNVGRKDPGTIAPDPQNVFMPICRRMTFANGRLFVGDVTVPQNSGTSNNRGDVWVSEYMNAFRFRKNIRYFDINSADSRSGTRVEFPGQTVKGFAKLPADVYQGEAVIVITDKDRYGLQGFDAVSISRPTPLGQHGTPSGESIAVKNMAIWYVDSDLQVRVIAGGQQDTPSRGTIEDKTTAVTAVSSFAGAYFNERYYLAYRPSGGSANTKLLGFSDRYGFFEFCDSLPSPCTAETLCVFNDSGVLKLFCQNNAGKIYRLEDPTATNYKDFGTTNITASLDTMSIHQDMWQHIAMTDIGLVVDDVTSGTATTTRTASPSGNTSTGTIDLDVTTNQSWRWDTLSSNPTLQRAGVDGNAIQATISIAAPGRTKVFAIRAKVEGLSDGADADPS